MAHETVDIEQDPRAQGGSDLERVIVLREKAPDLCRVIDEILAVTHDDRVLEIEINRALLKMHETPETMRWTIACMWSYWRVAGDSPGPRPAGQYLQ